MRKKLIVAGVLLTFVNSIVYAQQPSIRRCGTTEYCEQKELSNPEITAKRQQIKDFTTQWIADNPQQAKSLATITIPIVVHVVYKTTAENISDAQILSQITVLNNDYRRLNADASSTPSVWQGIAADIGIEFCMASVDPNGNPTNGIVRKATTLPSFNSNNDNVKFSSAGGDDAWPSNKYLNIWVCNLTGGVLGYATPPGFPADEDGVVIGYKYYGTTGTLDAVYKKGRTATHEIGHWLNLEHIWGGNGTGCSDSDGVSDTPNQAGENYGCPTFPNISCSNGPNGDMFMNYMDYTNDACMNLFTNGQKSIMLACLNGERASIQNSNACGGAPNPTDCSSLSNLSQSENIQIIPAYTSNGTVFAGYVSGNNTFNDKAKADKFTNSGSNLYITGGFVYFGVGYKAPGANNNVIFSAWNANGTGGSPGATIATQNVAMSTIAADVALDSLTLVTFNNPIIAPANFYMGIDLSNITSADSVAIYTSSNRAPNTAWELWSGTGGWHPYTDANGWDFSAGLSHAIFPILCPTVGVNEENIWEGVSVYPNPTSGNINVYLKLKANNDVLIRVFNPIGQLITSQNTANTMGATYNFDLNNQSSGLYFVEVTAGNISRTFKIVLTR